MRTRTRILAVLLAYAALTATIPASVPVLPPCATEDSDNCAWDASQHGNGHGLSFVTVNGVTYYTAR